jgi:hypothetical protein
MNLRASLKQVNHTRTAEVLALVALSVIAVGIMYVFLPTGKDWYMIRASVLEMLQGHSPFAGRVYNPPWIFVLLIPFAILPFRLSFAVISFCSIVVVGYVAYRLGHRPFAVVALLLTPAAIRQVFDPNLEWIVALGFILPPQFGLFLVLAKPQLGLPVAIFWLIEAFRRGGWKEAVRVFAPVTLVTFLSFALFGFWPMKALGLQSTMHNTSMWPTSLPFGAALLVYAIQRRKQDFSILSAPFLAPYYGFYSLHIPLLGLPLSPWVMIAASLGMWVMYLFGS